MRWPTIFVFTCVAIAALQAALPVLLVLLLLSVLWGVILRPVELLGFTGLLVFASAFQAHGLALVMLAGVLGLVALVRGPTTQETVTAERSELPLLSSDTDRAT
jgi:hypothetical protein